MRDWVASLGYVITPVVVFVVLVGLMVVEI